MPIKSLAISHSFAHHGKTSGYKRILDYTKPDTVFGIDESVDAGRQSWIKRYPWLCEFQAYFSQRSDKCDVVHLLYGETYYRFSPYLFRKTPLVATFHQPPERLRHALENGSETGRISRLVDRITRNRLASLSAAIIISEQQRAVLSEFMPGDRIHCIPLGAAATELIEQEKVLRRERDSSLILTVGNWLRDWDFYCSFVQLAQRERPNWRFVLVNRSLPKKYRERIKSYANLSFEDDVSDKGLLELYAGAGALFLPFKEATGNNTVNEALALGCPITTNVDLALPGPDGLTALFSRKPESALASLDQVLEFSEAARESLRHRTQTAVMSLDWSVMGSRTLELYQSLL